MRKWNRMLLLATLAASFACHADEGDPLPKCHQFFDPDHATPHMDVFDPAAPAHLRAAALDGFQKASTLAHCTNDIHTMGQLYRHGPDLPGNLLPKDTARARELLVRSAEAGRLSTYADLAEMALVEGEAREAMKWTQVYLYFLKNVGKVYMNKERTQFESAGYNADLLLRAERAWRKARPRLDRALIDEDLSTYVTRYRNEVAERIHGRMKAEQSVFAPKEPGELRLKRVGSCKPLRMKGVTAASVVYLMEVLPSGRIGRVVPESFSGNPVAMEKLAHCARVYEFEPFDGETPRVVRIPVTYGFADGYAPSFNL